MMHWDLNGHLEDLAIQELEREFEAKRANKVIKNNEKVKVGEQMQCPNCGKLFKKKRYQQKFCSNRGWGNCKDKYWNNVRGY